jgi:hypothetical protein
MNNRNDFSGITLAMAKALGKYEGLTKFLNEDNNTMTKEEIVTRLVQISEGYEVSVKKQS